MTGRLQLSASVICIIALTSPLGGYLKLGSQVTSGGVVGIQWDVMPIQYVVTNRSIPGVTAGQLQATVDRAFGTWGDVPDVRISSDFLGFGNADPFEVDGLNVIGFLSREDLDRTLGAATFEIDEFSGEILESDIFFNSAFDWSVAANGESGRFDLESIALHEVGHLLGLGHSALGETESQDGGRSVRGKRAVMFPIAYPRGNVEDRTLEADDRAGIADIYGDSDNALGSISGRVTLNGDGLFGAHVTAFNQHTGELVGGFTLNSQGGFVIAGLPPGLYVVRVEPLDDADIDSFFDEDTDVNINFRPAYHGKLVAVPAGGSSGSIEIRVQPK
jgi:hypothetical protein